MKKRVALLGATGSIGKSTLDVLLQADHLIDLGPEGGDKGGELVVAGTPEAVAGHTGSYTGRYLKELLDRR
jgi:excinuclease ABC subunit A